MESQILLGFCKSMTISTIGRLSDCSICSSKYIAAADLRRGTELKVMCTSFVYRGIEGTFEARRFPFLD